MHRTTQAAAAGTRTALKSAFEEDGVGTLPDGSPGAEVNLLSLSAPQTFSTSGPHEACGTVQDVLGNVSAPGCLTVQVDATPPSLALTCPATAILDTAGVQASYSASDGQSGLASKASGTIPISTSALGEQTVTETAIDNVGNETSRSCTTDVVYRFSGLAPVPGRKVTAGKAQKVKFVLGDALGYVTDGSATLEIAPQTGPEEGVYRPATSATNSGDRFQNEKDGKYSYILSTTGLRNGTWNLKVTVNDGTTHTTSILVR